MRPVSPSSGGARASTYLRRIAGTCGFVLSLQGALPALGADLPTFSGREAQAWIERQCSLGPRVPGTPPHRAWIGMVETYFDSLGVPLRREVFHRPPPGGGDTLTLTNLLASIRPGVRPRILLGSHWDSRPWADEDPDPALRTQPVPGANDGASGVAVLLVLARLMVETPPPLGVDLAFFDMEDMGRPGHPEEFCQGSVEMVRRWSGPLPDWVLVLDMVGSDRTEFGREEYSRQSAPGFLDLVFGLARDLGFTEWNPESGTAVVDDHLPFQALGVPSILVIGFNDPYWHTVRDDPFRTSPGRLGRVGSVMVELLYGGTLSR